MRFGRGDRAVSDSVYISTSSGPARDATFEVITLLLFLFRTPTLRDAICGWRARHRGSDVFGAVRLGTAPRLTTMVTKLFAAKRCALMLGLFRGEEDHLPDHKSAPPD